MNTTIKVSINQQPQNVAAKTTVDQLLVQLGLRKPYLAVAINENIIPRRQHAETELQDNDEITIVQAVGGG